MAVDEHGEAITTFIDPLILRARTRVGHTLDGKWRLDVLLGVGGMAAVYAATHRNGNRAAVKLLHTELCANRDVRSRFLREGYVGNSVGHPGTVKVIDDDVDQDGTPFLVFELLDGETVEARRVRLGGRLAEDDVLSVVDQVLDVLIAAHEKGVIHRDLKPENIFVERGGQVKVLDFGIAKHRAVSTSSTATTTGMAMGTPAYMPPEQARGLWDEVGPHSDLWAVGATMYTLLSGELVHQGRTPNEQLLSAMAQAAPSIASTVPGIGAAVAHLVDRALAFDREKRWPDARRMQEILRRVYHDRHNAPITTAPKLVVPETVPNRTIPTAEGAIVSAAPTTAQPVARPPVVVTSPGPARLSHGARLSLAAAGVVAVAVAASSATIIATGRHPRHDVVGGTAAASAPLPAAAGVPTTPSAASVAAVASAPSAAPPDAPAPLVVSVDALPKAQAAAMEGRIAPAAPAGVPTAVASIAPAIPASKASASATPAVKSPPVSTAKRDPLAP